MKQTVYLHKLLPELYRPSEQVRMRQREHPSQAIRHFDEGSRAWLQCVGSFFLMFNSFGLTNSFGISLCRLTL